MFFEHNDFVKIKYAKTIITNVNVVTLEHRIKAKIF